MFYKNNLAKLISSLSSTPVLIAYSIYALSPNQAALGQQHNSSGDDTSEYIEEIIVVGVKQSLELALENKRNADSIIDGIASEGIGKFPDLNLAEALQRIPGVQIDYAGAGGERRQGSINVRGLPSRYARTTYNGQTLATPSFSGGFVFGIFESAVVSGVDVVKSPTAAYDEGGLSGIVNIKTLRPLSIKEPFVSIGAEMDYEDLSQNFIPKYSLAAGRKFNDDKIGVFGTLKWSDQSFRTDSARISSYLSEDTDGDGLDDLYTPDNARVTSRQNEGSRLSAAGGVEFEINDELTGSVLGVYSAYDIENVLNQLNVRSPESTIILDTVLNDQVGDTVTELVFVDPQADVDSRFFDDQFDSSAITGDLIWRRGPWEAKGVLHYTEGNYDRFAVRSVRDINDVVGNGVQVLLDGGAGNEKGFQLRNYQDNGDFTSQDFWSYGDSVTTQDSTTDTNKVRQRFLAARGTERTEKETAIQFDLKRFFDGQLVTSLEGGIKFRQLKRHQIRPNFSTSDLNLDAIGDLSVLDLTSGTKGAGFFGGNLPGVTDYWVPSYDKVVRDVLAGSDLTGRPLTDLGLPFSLNNNATINADRDILSGYVMARFDAKETGLGLPLRGNVGVRSVSTKRDISTESTYNLSGDPDADPTEDFNSAAIDFSNVLPSANLIWDIQEDMLVRFAYAETITRPNASTFSANADIDVDYVLDPMDPMMMAEIVDDIEIDLGNPSLKPFSSDSFDMSYEWYFQEGSGLTIAYFYKDIQDGISERQLCPANINDVPALAPFDFSNVITGSLEIIGDECLAESVDPGLEPIPVEINESINDGEGFRIQGWEIGILHDLSYLDNWMSGFGVKASYTNIDASQGPDLDASGNRLPLPNVSEDTANAILFYDAEDWGVRLAYNYRGKYFVTSTNTFSGDDRFIDNSDRLDFSASWKPIENLKLQIEAFNLLNEMRYEYQGSPERMRDIRYRGRTYTLGVRYKF